MRRILGLVLAAVLIAPLFPVPASESNLPSCCRRDGKHHCAMTMDSEESSSPSVRASACVSFPSVQFVQTRIENGIPKATNVVSGPIYTGIASSPGHNDKVRFAVTIAHHKRGPPSVA